MKINSNTEIVMRDGRTVLLEDVVKACLSETIVEDKLSELRERRIKECFSVVDRGELWYNSLTDEQYMELKNWRLAWLDVTETMIIPQAPKWLNDKLEGDNIL